MWRTLPAFQLQTVFWVPYFPPRTACLFTYGKKKFVRVCVITSSCNSNCFWFLCFSAKLVLDTTWVNALSSIPSLIIIDLKVIFSLKWSTFYPLGICHNILFKVKKVHIIKRKEPLNYWVWLEWVDEVWLQCSVIIIYRPQLCMENLEIPSEL